MALNVWHSFIEEKINEFFVIFSINLKHNNLQNEVDVCVCLVLSLNYYYLFLFPSLSFLCKKNSFEYICLSRSFVFPCSSKKYNLFNNLKCITVCVCHYLEFSLLLLLLLMLFLLHLIPFSVYCLFLCIFVYVCASFLAY